MGIAGDVLIASSRRQRTEVKGSFDLRRMRQAVGYSLNRDDGWRELWSWSIGKVHLGLRRRRAAEFHEDGSLVAGH